MNSKNIYLPLNLTKRYYQKINNWFQLKLITKELHAKGIVFKSIRNIQGRPYIRRHPDSDIQLGWRIELMSNWYSNVIGINHPVIIETRSPGSRIIIGDDVGISGASIVANKEIIIGNRVLIGANSIIVDNDFHDISVEVRRYTKAIDGKSIIIGNDVFIGMNSIILKGVIIGDSSIIGAGSVVTQNIPPKTVAAGNPAIVIRGI